MAELIELLKYMILGIIQGITEIFPVSSSGHLVIFSHLFLGGDEALEQLTLFLMITNAGSFLALMWFYRKDILTLITDSYTFVFNKKSRTDTHKSSFFYVLKLLIAVIPLGIVGFIMKDILPTNLLVVGGALLFTSLTLFIVFLLRNHRFYTEVTWKNAVGIGLFQTLAIIPGVSRSGITLVGGMSQRIEIQKVLKFSFLSYLVISIPVSLLGVYDAINNPGTIHIPGFIIAFICSFIFSLLTVKVLHRFVTVKNLVYFAIYCLMMGSLALILNFI